MEYLSNFIEAEIKGKKKRRGKNKQTKTLLRSPEHGSLPWLARIQDRGKCDPCTSKTIAPMINAATFSFSFPSPRNLAPFLRAT